MIDLTKKGLPNTILVNGCPIFINTDFRVWIRFYEDYTNSKEEVDISYLFVEESPIIDEEVINQLVIFLFNPNVTPRTEGGVSEKTLDYILDGEYIFSALYQTYGIDITESDMHWHKFLAMCNNITGDSTLWGYAKSMRGYRKSSKNDSYEKDCMEAKTAWSFPLELTEEEQTMKDEFDNYFDWEVKK